MKIRVSDKNISQTVLTILAGIIAGSTSGLLTSCNYNDLKNVPSPAGKTGGQNPELIVDFATVKSKVLDSACVRCHSGANPRGGVRLETYQQVFEIRDSLRVQVDTGAMPPRPPGLSPEQKSLVLAWVDSGAPERTVVTPPPGESTNPTPPTEPGRPPGGGNDNDRDEDNNSDAPPVIVTPAPPSPPTPAPPVTVPTFAEVSAKVFIPHCVKCHSHDGAKGGVNLEDFASAKKYASEIAFTLDTDDMPRRAPALPPELKAIVYAWIDGGTPEN
jgi:mono/diheme cytochrome c family protein